MSAWMILYRAGDSAQKLWYKTGCELLKKVMLLIYFYFVIDLLSKDNHIWLCKLIVFCKQPKKFVTSISNEVIHNGIFMSTDLDNKWNNIE